MAETQEYKFLSEYVDALKRIENKLFKPDEADNISGSNDEEEKIKT